MKKKGKKESNDEIELKIINSFYSNGIGAGFSPRDFVINFSQYPGESEKDALVTRIFLSPKSFKEAVIFLKERLDDYEKECGEINLT
ncbi:MAG: DUF3467 domain-containing protein [Candidatus Methanoperedens sp.]|nr:DUF3467 domain-containing protein [Candidatus Methanoperedens sp.]